ncbi:MAG TPA: hypothetical protein VGI39_27385 [Polyangiaceae bacterium]|jgi:hypothetical protein
MTHACQSASTLGEILNEAAEYVARTTSPRASDLNARVTKLRQVLRAGGEVSAEMEHEIVSLYEVARIEVARSRPRSLHG